MVINAAQVDKEIEGLQKHANGKYVCMYKLKYSLLSFVTQSLLSSSSIDHIREISTRIMSMMKAFEKG